MKTRAALYLSLLAPLTAAAVEPALVPVAYFTPGPPTYSLASLSPDGKHVAVAVRTERDGASVPTLTVYAVPELKQVSTIALRANEAPSTVRWLGNDRVVMMKPASFSTDGLRGTAPEVLATNLDGTQPQYLYGPNASAQKIKVRPGNDYGSAYLPRFPIGRNGHFMLGSDAWLIDHSRLYDIDSVTSARKLLAEIPVKPLFFTLQHDGKPRFASGAKENNKPLLYRLDDADSQWNLVNLDEAIERYKPIAFTPDNKALYVSYAKAGAPLSLAREDMRTGVRTIIGSDPLGDVDRLLLTSREGVPFAWVPNVGIARAHYLDDKAPEAQLHKMLSASFPRALVQFVDFSDDGQRLLFLVAGDRDPDSYYLFDKKTGKADFLFANMDNIDPNRMAESRPMTFKARDGLTLTGFLTLPAHQGNARLPMVLLPHNGPVASNNWFFDTDAQFLASRGYAVLQVNFRGSSGRGTQFEAAGYKQYGLKIMDDLIDSVKWASALPEIDGSRVCVYGEGFGAYAALMLPVRAPGMFKCAAGRAGYYDLEKRYNKNDTVDQKPAKVHADKIMGDDPALLRQQSPLTFASDIAIPVLLIKGIRDDLFLPQHAETMREALTRAGHAPEWLVEKAGESGNYDTKRQQVLYERLEAFLGKYLAQ